MVWHKLSPHLHSRLWYVVVLLLWLPPSNFHVYHLIDSHATPTEQYCVVEHFHVHSQYDPGLFDHYRGTNHLKPRNNLLLITHFSTAKQFNPSLGNFCFPELTKVYGSLVIQVRLFDCINYIVVHFFSLWQLYKHTIQGNPTLNQVCGFTHLFSVGGDLIVQVLIFLFSLYLGCLFPFSFSFCETGQCKCNKHA